MLLRHTSTGGPEAEVSLGEVLPRARLRGPDVEAGERADDETPERGHACADDADVDLDGGPDGDVDLFIGGVG